MAGISIKNVIYITLFLYTLCYRNDIVYKLGITSPVVPLPTVAVQF